MPTWCACVAQVKVDRQTGQVTVQKLWMEIDAGSIIDPDGAMAQAQGGTLWGLSMALYEGTGFENGYVKDLNLDTYTPLRMADVPVMDIAFVDSAEAPVGLGEPPTTVVAPRPDEPCRRPDPGRGAAARANGRGASVRRSGVASCR